MEKGFGYPEYQHIVDEFVSRVRETLRDRLISVVLYGSVARRKAHLTSDVDLLVVVEKAPRIYYRRLEPLLPIIRQLRSEACWQELEQKGFYPSLSVLVLSREEADQNRCLYLDMIEDSRILFDRGGFFRRRLQKLKRRLEELGSRRIELNGAWYWDLKPDLKPGEVVEL